MAQKNEKLYLQRKSKNLIWKFGQRITAKSKCDTRSFYVIQDCYQNDKTIKTRIIKFYLCRDKNGYLDSYEKAEQICYLCNDDEWKLEIKNY